MKIGTLNKSSLIDYPGKIASVIGTQGCNMHCPWCHNAFLIPHAPRKSAEAIDIEGIMRFLAHRAGFLDGVVITGGEPTIQPDLPAFCERVKRMGLAVKIDTNGTHPDVIRTLLSEKRIDYIAMDLKTDLGQYDRIAWNGFDPDDILRSIDIIMSSAVPYEFRTTCASPFVTVENIEKMLEPIKGARVLFLQKGNPPEHLPTGPQFEILEESHLVALKAQAAAYVQKCEIR